MVLQNNTSEDVELVEGGSENIVIRVGVIEIRVPLGGDENTIVVNNREAVSAEAPE